MPQIIQSGLRRGRIANRLGWVLFFALVLVLFASVLAGVSHLTHA